jgi:FMN phosphatase YigB (HAD superfamily)
MISAARTIIFDLGKVIVDFDHMFFCRNASLHCDLNPDEIYRKIFHAGLEKSFDSGALTPEAFFDAASSTLGLKIEIDLFAYLWSDIFTIIKGIEALIDRLKQQYRLICLSNTNPWHFNWCRQHFKVLEAFDACILSYECHCCKPDLDIYKKTLEKAGTLPEMCLYIDDIADNVAAAQQLNMQGIVFSCVVELEQALLDNGYLQPYSSINPQG